MRHVNYNHLLYFWTVARTGSVARAAEELHLTPQTVSGQIKQLEQTSGAMLFERTGRRLVLTEHGEFVFRYADSIFRIGTELSERIRTLEPDNDAAMHVGIVNSIPKLIAYQMLSPVIGREHGARLVCREGELDSLMGELSVHRLDLIISDQPFPSELSVRARSHELGTSAIAMFAATRQARRYQGRFPQSLDGAPLLLPTAASALREHLDDWFNRQEIAPHVVAEFDDSALLKAFGEAGDGVFPGPAVIAAHIETMYSCRQVGVCEGLREAYYAIVPERHVNHPATFAIMRQAAACLKSGKA